MLVAFEGISGSGKTFISKCVFDKLKTFNIDVVLIGGFELNSSSSILTKFIRSELLNNDFFIGLPWPSETYLLISEMLNEIDANVKSGLDRGALVLYDSYWDSIYAYQFARANKYEHAQKQYFQYHLNELENQLIGNFMPNPDIKIYLKCEFEKCILRIKSREKTNLNQIEILTLKQIKEVYESPNKILTYKTFYNNDDSPLVIQEISNLILPIYEHKKKNT